MGVDRCTATCRWQGESRQGRTEDVIEGKVLRQEPSCHEASSPDVRILADLGWSIRQHLWRHTGDVSEELPRACMGRGVQSRPLNCSLNGLCIAQERPVGECSRGVCIAHQEVTVQNRTRHMLHAAPATELQAHVNRNSRSDAGYQGDSIPLAACMRPKPVALTVLWRSSLRSMNLPGSTPA